MQGSVSDVELYPVTRASLFSLASTRLEASSGSQIDAENRISIMRLELKHSGSANRHQG